MPFETIYDAGDVCVTLQSKEAVREHRLTPTWVVISDEAALALGLSTLITTYTGHLARVDTQSWDTTETGCPIAAVRWLCESAVLARCADVAVTQRGRLNLCQPCAEVSDQR